MNYLIAFLSFWKKFILGDDNRIAITVMWAYLFVISWMQEFYNAWFVFPLIIAGMMTVLLFLQRHQHGLFHRLPPASNLFYFLELPMILCLVVPLAVFRINNGDQTAEHLLIPIVVFITIVVVYGLVMMRLFQKYPSLVSFIGGVITYVLLVPAAATMNRFAYQLAHVSSPTFVLIAVVLLLIYIIQAGRMVWRDTASA